MDKKTKNFKLGISLRIKIIITFLLFISLVCLFLSFSTYQILAHKLLRELQNKVKNLAYLGSYTLNQTALIKLASALKLSLNREETEQIENSTEYQILSDDLNRIRDMEKALIRYIYIVAPTADSQITRYLVDADVLELKKQIVNDKTIRPEEISHFGSVLEVDPYPNLGKSIREKALLIDNEFSYDKVYHVNSITGYAPLLDKQGNLLGILGLDMTDLDVRSALKQVTGLFILIAFIAEGLALLVSLILGTMFTRGIIYLDRIVRRFGDKDLTARADVKSRDEVGRLGLSFNQMAQTIQTYSRHLEALLTAYGKFVPHDFLKFLGKESILEVKLGDQISKEMTVLFSDIRSFTTLSETMTPEENFNFINSYLKRVGPIIRQYQGIIDKYIGDAIMALFPDSADHAIQAGIEIQKEVQVYNGHRQKNGYQLIAVGVGIHTGRLMMGTVGERERMDGTVIADAVNLASRLEGLTKIYTAGIIISGNCLALVRDRGKYHLRYVDNVQVKGKNKAVPLYEIMDGDPLFTLELKVKYLTVYQKAIDLYLSKQFNEAYQLFKDLIQASPADKVYHLYYSRIEALLKNGIPEDWNGVFHLDSK